MNDFISPLDNPSLPQDPFESYIVPLNTLPSEEEVRKTNVSDSKYPSLWKDTFPRFSKLPSYKKVDDLKLLPQNEHYIINVRGESVSITTDVIFLPHGLNPMRMSSGLELPDCIYSNILGSKNSNPIRNNFFPLVPMYNEETDPRVEYDPIDQADVMFLFSKWLKSTHTGAEWGHEDSYSGAQSRQNPLMKALWKKKTVAIYIYNFSTQRIEIFSMALGGFNKNIKAVLEDFPSTMKKSDMSLDTIFNPYTLLSDTYLKKCNPNGEAKYPVVQFKTTFPKKDRSALSAADINIGVSPIISYVDKSAFDIKSVLTQIQNNTLADQRVFYPATEQLEFLAESANPLDRSLTLAQSFPEFFEKTLEELMDELSNKSYIA